MENNIFTRIFLGLWVGMLIYALSGCAGNSQLSQTSTVEVEKITVDSVCEEILNTPEENINLGKYTLLLTKAVCPNMNLEWELKNLDRMADAVRPRLEGINEPQKIVEIFNKYFFAELRFEGKQKLDDDPDYDLLHNVLWRKKGHCVSIGISYLCLAERLHLPFFGVVIPNHFFVRYDDGKRRINIETTSGDGRSMADDEYLREFAPLLKDTTGNVEIKRKLLRNATKKEVLATYLMNALILKYHYPKQDKESKIKAVDYAIKMEPDSFSNYCKKGIFLLSIGREKNDSNILRQAVEYSQIAYDKYPYYLTTITALAIEYYFLEEYENCIKKINEFGATYLGGGGNPM
ncbi:MAG: transglutaminase family protein [Planctomycetota bacterium]